MDHSRPLSELGQADEPRFGGKSARLGELLSAGIPVPPGFALSIDAFEAFVDGAGLSATIAAAVSGLQASDVAAITAAASAIDEGMRSAPVPEPVCRAVQARYRELGDDVPVAVRSSAVGEDSHGATFAGQQESYLWVRGFEPLCEAVRDCWISLFSPLAISYRLGIGSPTNAAAMGVAVQLMVDAAVAGVMFTCNPISGDRSMVAINASWGLGPAVVGGEVTPDDFLLSKVTGEVVREHVHPKPIEYVADTAGPGTIRVAVPEPRRSTRCLDDAALAGLVELAQRIERHFGSHQDIEWAIDHDGHAFVVQSRPVTGLRPRDAKPMPADALSMVMGTFGAHRSDGP